MEAIQILPVVTSVLGPVLFGLVMRFAVVALGARIGLLEGQVEELKGRVSQERLARIQDFNSLHKLLLKLAEDSTPVEAPEEAEEEPEPAEAKDRFDLMDND